MAKLEEKNKLDYRPGGDTVDDFAQKYMAEMTRIYQFLNNLRTHSTDGVDYVEPEPYQFKVEDEKLYIRNKSNDAWILLMDISEYGGFRTGTFGKLQTGTAADMPTTGNADYDTYWSDDGRVYQWLNGKWNIILSKNLSDLNGYDELLQEAGKIDGRPTTTKGIEDGQIMVYRESEKGFVPENKGPSLGTGKALTIMSGDEKVVDYDGSKRQILDLQSAGTWKIDSRGYIVPNIPYED